MCLAKRIILIPKVSLVHFLCLCHCTYDSRFLINAALALNLSNLQLAPVKCARAVWIIVINMIYMQKYGYVYFMFENICLR